MKWKRLIEDNCPNCGRHLVESGAIMVCSFCDFKITNSKKIQIICSFDNKVIEQVEQRSIEFQKEEDDYWKDPDF